METAEKTIENKFKLLSYYNKDTELIINRRKERELERKRKNIEETLEEVYAMKIKTVEEKIIADVNQEEIDEWAAGIDGQTNQYEELLEQLKDTLTVVRKEAEEESRREKEQRSNQVYEEELRQERMKLEVRRELSTRDGEDFHSFSSRSSEIRAKLPKLTITKFNGTNIDWLRFWSQFRAEIDKSNLPQVTKFSYLKELLIQKVRISIDGLPFSPEGYERAKNILKTKYGKDSEIVHAHIQQIMNLPTITGNSPTKIHEFYEKLLANIQALETMGKLREINGYVRTTIDRLPGIRSDLVRNDEEWQKWKFPELVEELTKWTERNPITNEQKRDINSINRRDHSFHTQQQSSSRRICIYCDGDHKPVECQNVNNVNERRKIITFKRLCFNCTRGGHRANDCTSKGKCFICGSKHHTSICDRPKGGDQQTDQIMMTTEGSVTYPVVVVKVNGIKCRALLDTGAGSAYASSTLIDRLNIDPSRKETRQIEMLMHTANRKIEVYKLKITNVEESFQLCTEVSKIEKPSLLSISNPHYEQLIQKFNHLKGINMVDTSDQERYPINLILGTNEICKSKTTVRARVGTPGQPIAEYTKFGWVIMSPGKDLDFSEVYLTRSVSEDYDKLCSLDVLGIEDTDDQNVYSDFKDQLVRNTEGWYETGLLWKIGHPVLPSNEFGSLGRLNTLLRKLKRTPQLLEQYHEVIQKQLEEGIVERVDEKSDSNEREYYLPHKAVIKEAAETTKLRVVFDASAKANGVGPSLNDCLETGPSLQKLIWDILVKNRFQPVALTGDLRQAFLQIRIREEDRNLLRFHWIKDLQKEELDVLRFTRAVFGLIQSPFFLGGT